MRHTYIGLVSKTFGALTTGHTSDAADGAAKIDRRHLRGRRWFRRHRHRQRREIQGSNGAYSKKKSIGSVFNNGDGTRTSLVRYDTLSLGGFTGHVSVAQGGWGVGSLTYSGAVAGQGRRRGWIFNASSNDEVADGDVNAHWVGSVSALHESGVSGTLSYAKVVDVNGNRDKPMSYHAKLGYQAKLIDPGKSYFSVGYGRGENWQANGDEADEFSSASSKTFLPQPRNSTCRLAASRWILQPPPITRISFGAWPAPASSSKPEPGTKGLGVFPARTEPSPVVGPVAATRKISPRPRGSRGFPV